MKEAPLRMRVDKWLWNVRLFKTRTQSSEACAESKISIAGQPVKASRLIQAGDEIKIRKTGLTRTIKVVKLTDHRLSPKLVEEFYTDLTPPEEIENYESRVKKIAVYRDPGTGRPTKRDRRMLDDFFS